MSEEKREVINYQFRALEFTPGEWGDKCCCHSRLIEHYGTYS